MILACLAQLFPLLFNANILNGFANLTPFPEKFQAVYIVSPHPFPKVNAFVALSSTEYYLKVMRYMLPIKKGLDLYLTNYLSIQAVFVRT